MKKNYFLFFTLFFALSVSQAQMTDIEEDFVICSDDFEDATPSVKFSAPVASVELSNSQGGSPGFSWAKWNGAMVNSDHSAEGGTQCLEATKGGVLYVDGFTMDPEAIYQLEIMMHPPNGKNKWGAIHLMTEASSVLWQKHGFRIRAHNKDESSDFTNSFDVEHWPGIEGENAIEAVYDFYSEASNVYQDGANEIDFWIPLKLIFTGAGTTDSPFKIDYYVNEVLQATQEYDNVVLQGAKMIGLSNNGNDGENAMWDNFKLTMMKKVTTSINNLNDFNVPKVYPTFTSDYVTIEIENPLEREAKYQVYNLYGQLLNENKITSHRQDISLQKLKSSIYVIKVVENNIITRAYKIIKK